MADPVYEISHNNGNTWEESHLSDAQYELFASYRDVYRAIARLKAGKVVKAGGGVLFRIKPKSDGEKLGIEPDVSQALNSVGC